MAGGKGSAVFGLADIASSTLSMELSYLSPYSESLIAVKPTGDSPTGQKGTG